MRKKMSISDLTASALLTWFQDPGNTMSDSDALSLKGFTANELVIPLNVATEEIRDTFAQFYGEPVKFTDTDVRTAMSKLAGEPWDEGAEIIIAPKGKIASEGRGGSTFYVARAEFERYENAFEGGPSHDELDAALSLAWARQLKNVEASVWGKEALLRKLGVTGSVEKYLADNA